MRVVVDTNVIVSALINVNGFPAKVLSLILNGGIKILYDNRILFEYMDVLSRRKFVFSTEAVSGFIDYVRHSGEFINADILNVNFDDEDDKVFYEVYKSGEAHYLVTGNMRHFPDDHRIISPKEFIDRLIKVI
ncbi:MAG: putative toxin-antitoxin system toxin component, PIN family [Chitinispirillales bacterium]|nr:putative toxin-antitoxin system toxin component, PIN family [Chitinispirillales bacterium]